jgi:cytoskeletal protein CcmA (bactofilin family)
VGKSVSVEVGEVIDDDLFVAANSVHIAGQVTGDVFAAGESVRVTGEVDGSVFAAGRDVRVTAEVGGSAWTAGQTVSLSGPVRRNAAAAGQTVVIEEGADIGRDLHAGGGTLDLVGSVGRLASLAGQTATVRGDIGGALKFNGDSLTLGPGASVAGDLMHCCTGKLDIAPNALIGGQTRDVTPPPSPEAEPPKPSSPVMPAIFLFVTVLACGAAGIAAAPRFFVGAANAVGSRPWWNLLLGLLALIVLPITAAVVCVTVIGLPLGIVALVLWGAGLLLAGVPVGTSVGRWLLAKLGSVGPSAYAGLFLGLLLLTLVGFVPYLGGLTKVLTVLFGLGAYSRAAKGVLVDMRQTG